MRTLFSFLITAFIVSQLGAQVSINGYLRTYERIRLNQDGKISWNENTLNLKFEGSPSERVHFYSEVRLRGFGFPTANSTTDLQSRAKEAVQPWGIEFREAYVDIYGFLSENLDVRIGRQRIAWGTADKLNPTDNLNPDDLEDIFNFGRHLGSNAIKATYYLNDWTLTGVFIPTFTPATLPYDDWANAFTDALPLPPGVFITSFKDSLLLPENKLSKSSSYAFKIATELMGFDVSLSYYNGRDDLPLFKHALFLRDPNFQQGIGYKTYVEMTYPRLQVIGADLAGSIGSVGVWAEGALFFPNKEYSYTTFPNIKPYPPTITRREVALDDKPYLKFVLGGDYTFKSGWYVNAQYLHGFIHERGRDNLNDYFLVRFEKNFFNDALKIVPFGMALTVTDWKDVKNNYGFAGGPEIDYYPLDALEISLGAFLIDGKGDNIFSKVQNFDEGFFKITYSF